jgi:hypothetical protein
MKIREITERLGAEGMSTGRVAAYIKDGLEELNMISETHVKTQRINIEKDKRFYELPKDVIRIIDIRCKNHLNTKDEYRSIPRLVGNLTTKDADGE